MRRGFTLIEILLVMVVLAIFGWFATANFLGTNRRQALGVAMERTRQIFQVAKANAFSGKKNCRACGAPGPNYVCGTGDATLDGWRITMTAGTPGTYTLVGVCGASTFGSVTEGVGTSQITMTVSGGPTVLFRSGGNGTSLGGNLVVTFTDSFSNTGTVTVTPRGDIL